MGGVPHNKIFQLLDDIDLYIQPSLQEGLPRSVVEAMSRACPIIGQADLILEMTTGYSISDEWGKYVGETTNGAINISRFVESALGKQSVQVNKNLVVLLQSERMALEDFNDGNEPYYCWYAGAYGNMTDYATATSEDFGSGRANTIAMIANWNQGANGGYGAQDEGAYKDMWGVIQTEAGNIENPTWFVPSRAEWSAFASNLNITADNYVNHDLSDCYWSSSQYGTDRAWLADFSPRGYVPRRCPLRRLCAPECDFLIV